MPGPVRAPCRLQSKQNCKNIGAKLGFVQFNGLKGVRVTRSAWNSGKPSTPWGRKGRSMATVRPFNLI